MVYENPLYDKKFKLALSDVVYRFHIRNQYGNNPEKAIKLWRKEHLVIRLKITKIFLRPI